MSKAQLIEIARRDLAHGRAGTVDQADDVLTVPAQNYVDPERWQAEVRLIFKRLPLLMATTAEVRNPGDFKALRAVGVEVLITRLDSGEIRAFVNMCSHRGARLVDHGHGQAKRFTCPYHAWTYAPSGELAAVYDKAAFGEIDMQAYGLTRLPCLERAGLIWVTLDPASKLDIAQFLSGYDELLAEFHFEDWCYHSTQQVPGPNWKVAYDGYLDFYHLPILHRATFGTEIGHRANYSSWGPHIHVGQPDTSWEAYEDLAEDEWPTEKLLGGIWTIFPHVSIASFAGGGRSVMISQLFPGDRPEESFTNQIFLMAEEPATEELAREAKEQFAFLRHVVADEDYATGLALQRNLASGAKADVLFGKNERGGQMFHRWLDRVLATPDEDLPTLFCQR